MEFLESVTYKADFFMYFFGIILEIVVMSSIWTVLFKNKPEIGGSTLKGMITYSVLVFVLNSLMGRFRIYNFIVSKIRTGDIALELLRPINFQLNIFSKTIGMSLFQLIFIATPFTIIAFFSFGLTPPKDVFTLILFIISVLMSYMVNFGIFYIFSLSIFFTIENFGIVATFYITSSFFSGLIIPLWLFPPFLKNIALFLPFHTVFYTPVSIYLSKITGIDILYSFLLQLFWIVILYVAGFFLWKLTEKKIIIQGG